MYLRYGFRFLLLIITVHLVMGLASFTFAFSDDSVKKEVAASYGQKFKILKSQLRDDGNNGMIFDQMEQIAQEYYQSYPEEMKKPELYEAIAETVQNYDVERARKLYQKIEKIGNDDWARQAADKLYYLTLLGKPFYLHFNSMDGRSVDLTHMKGKVVLIDYWATLSDNSMKDIPVLKQLYEEYHEKGFEIVGISFDTIMSDFLKAVKDNAIPWPQYYEEKSKDNYFGKIYDISVIPTMWMVNKNGILVDTNARENLDVEIAKLLGNVPIPGTPPPSSPTPPSTETTGQNYKPATHLNLID